MPNFMEVLRELVNPSDQLSSAQHYGGHDRRSKRLQRAHTVPRPSYVAEPEDDDDDEMPKDEDDEETEHRPVVRVFSEDVRPDVTSANAMSVALQEMLTCKTMFDKWAEQVDRNTGGKQSDLERDLIGAIDELRNQADDALEASSSILDKHEKFAHQMDVLLEQASTHPKGDLLRPTELMEIGDQILDQSSQMALHSNAMQSQLKYVLRIVQDIRKRQERRLMWKKILSWLVKAFNILATILAIGALVMPLILPPIGMAAGAALGAGAVLCTAAAVVCKDMSRETDAERNFDKMVKFLEVTVPKQAVRAEKSLSAFQECHRVLQLDVQMKQGKCVRISRMDAERAREEWRSHREALAEVNRAIKSKTTVEELEA